MIEFIKRNLFAILLLISYSIFLLLPNIATAGLLSCFLICQIIVVTKRKSEENEIIEPCKTIKGEEKIDSYAWTIHGEVPLCKCGSGLFLLGSNNNECEWVCIKCEPDRFKMKGDKNG